MMHGSGPRAPQMRLNDSARHQDLWSRSTAAHWCMKNTHFNTNFQFYVCSTGVCTGPPHGRKPGVGLHGPNIPNTFK